MDTYTKYGRHSRMISFHPLLLSTVVRRWSFSVFDELCSLPKQGVGLCLFILHVHSNHWLTVVHFFWLLGQKVINTAVLKEEPSQFFLSIRADRWSNRLKEAAESFSLRAQGHFLGCFELWILCVWGVQWFGVTVLTVCNILKVASVTRFIKQVRYTV